ncbi:MAG: hypothetical protein IH616_04840 [Gemmatimonadales bacterium]|nr:hypothetical protein [Gemmatimonadales bacterium]
MALLVGAGAGLACGGDPGLPPASWENTVDTTEMWALRGTAIGTPSAFDLISALAVRPERADPFDFAFDIDSTGAATLYPSGLLGGSQTAGLHVARTAFDDILRAPLEDYVTDSVTAIDVGTVFVARSRAAPDGCSALTGALPRYGKFEVLSIDAVARTVTFQMLVNLNCGYRQLEPGVPVN